MRNPAVSFITNMVLTLKVEQDSLTQQIAELDAQQRVAEQRVAAVRAVETRLVELNRQRDVINDAYREYIKRQEAAKIEETASSVRAANVRIVQSAADSVTRRNMRFPFIAVSLFGALLFGAAAGSVSSSLRTVFIQPREAEQSLQIPSLAEFSNSSDAFDNAEGHIALTALASQLLDAQFGERSLKTLQIIGVRAEGKEQEFSRALAEELGEGRQLRTLLIDFSHPTTAVPATSEPNRLTITPASTPNLWLATGPATLPGATLRAPVADTRRILDELEKQYDIILVCSPPQSIVYFTQRLAAVVERKSACVAWRAHSRAGGDLDPKIDSWKREEIWWGSCSWGENCTCRVGYTDGSKPTHRSWAGGGRAVGSVFGTWPQREAFDHRAEYQFCRECSSLVRAMVERAGRISRRRRRQDQNKICRYPRDGRGRHRQPGWFHRRPCDGAGPRGGPYHPPDRSGDHACPRAAP